MNRRRFLYGLGTLAAASTFTNRAVASQRSLAKPGESIGASAETKAGHRGSLIELRRSASSFSNTETFRRFREDLLSCAVNPWLKVAEWCDSPDFIEALVEVRHSLTESKIVAVIDYCDVQRWEEKIEGKISFMDWLEAFKPLNRYDCAMAIPLYRRYSDFVEFVPNLQMTPDPWLDALLKDTRGLLFWRDQLVDLIRMVTGNRGMANDIAKGLLKRDPVTLASGVDTLRKARYFGTGQSLLAIIEERSVNGWCSCWGIPDYVTADWLLQYLSET